jgi:hypothetical protein
MLQQLCKQLKIVFWGSKQVCFWGFKKRDFLLARFLEGEGFLAWIRYLREGERREERGEVYKG